MGKTESKKAKLNSGVTESASGETAPIVFVRNGVIKGLKNPIPVKRPNQYKPKWKI